MENKQTITNDCIVAVAKGQTVVRTEVDVQERGGAAKLLSVGTDAVVNSVEAVAGEARIYGRVNYKILYLDEEGKVCGLDYFGEYDMIVRDDAIAVGNTLAQAEVLDADCTLVGGVMHLEAVCEVSLLQVVAHTAEAVTDVEGECRKEVIEAASLSPIPDSTFEVVEELESHVGVDRVLLFDAKALHTATRAGVDSTTVEGKLYAEVVYRAQGQIYTQEIVADFAEQLDLEGEADLAVSVRQAKLVLTGEEDNTVLRVEMLLAVSGYRVERRQYEVLADAYVEGADVSLCRDSFACRRYVGLNCRTERVSQRIDPAVLDIRGNVMAATVARINVANYVAGEGQITAEGLAVAGVLYVGEDGVMQSGEVELPFSVSFAAPEVDAECTLAGDAIALSVSATGQSVQMELLFAVKCYRPYAVCYVTRVDAVPCTAPRAVMSVYFAPADASVWDIARAVHVSPSTLLQQNPALAEPAEDAGLRRVLVFRHRDL